MKDNYKFDKEGNFYLRSGEGKCSECELPSNMCSLVKCVDSNKRYVWKQHNEMYIEFLKSKGLIKDEEDKSNQESS